MSDAPSGLFNFTADMLTRRDPELTVGILLWTASQTFAGEGAGDEFAFLDIAMRLYAGAIVKLDAAAARDYLAALADRHDPAIEGEARFAAEERRIEAWARLHATLRLLAHPAEGQC